MNVSPEAQYTLLSRSIPLLSSLPSLPVPFLLPLSPVPCDVTGRNGDARPRSLGLWPVHPVTLVGCATRDALLPEPTARGNAADEQSWSTLLDVLGYVCFLGQTYATELRYFMTI